MAGEKTEKATPKRKRDERKKGNVFLSREIVTVFSLLACFYSIKLLSPLISSALTGSIRDFFAMGSTMETIVLDDIPSLVMKVFLMFFLAALPLMLVSILVAVIFTMGQTRMLVSTKAIAPKFDRINPLKGLKKMISLRGIVELLKSLLKILVMGVIVWNVLSGWIPTLPKMMDMSVEAAINETGNVILNIVQQVSIVFVGLAIFDYVYQWWDYEKNLRMSKQEVKEEYKQTEGDPKVKGQIKDRQQQMSRQRMMQNVPNADVVIRNPTHYAVAIQYDPEKNSAPVVVAKGVDSLALRIVAVAEQHGVYVTENKPLARGLYESVDLDREIPEKFYKTVAEVLAFVYSLRKKEEGLS